MTERRIRRLSVCVFFALAFLAGEAIAEKPKSLLTKIPVNFGQAMENTPVIFHGKPLLVYNYRNDDPKTRTGDCKKDMYLKIQDLCTGEILAKFAEGHSFANAIVVGSEMHVFATQGHDKDWFHDIYRFSSTDLKTWKRKLAVPRDAGEHLFNCSVCRDGQNYLMAYESDKPLPFCFRFARSKDLKQWEKIPGLTFTGEKKEYSACPAIRYFAPYYYVIYLHAAIPGHNGWVSFLARSKDLATWQLSPANPILEAGPGEGCNNSDVDLFEWEGNTYLFYATGDQQTWGSVRMAMYPGPMRKFFESCFPEGAAMTTVSAAPQTAKKAVPPPRIETAAEHDRRMAWWRDARFGLFIHWGIMSIPGKDCLVMNADKIPVREYEKLVGQYNPVRWNAHDVVEMAKNAGQKYIVFVAKHHDGFCMWDSKLTDYNITRSPYGKDIVRQLADECAKQGLVFCFYYSILDWRHPDANHERWPKYVEYMKGQLRELLTHYGPIGVVWFDGEWTPEWTDDQGRDLARFIWSLQPNTIINNRIGKGRQNNEGDVKKECYAADFGTPEKAIPPNGLPGVDWESCMTINNSWSWNRLDVRHKDTAQCIRMLVDTTSKGGNLLLNIGPHPDGSILPLQKDRLGDLAKWMRVNGEAIQGATASPFPKPLAWGRCSQKKLPDGGTRLYLYVFDWPKDGRLAAPTPNTHVVRAYLLADSNRASLSVNPEGDQIIVSLPNTPSDPNVSVVVMDLSR
jgi:alpha-L-fucosidase